MEIHLKMIPVLVALKSLYTRTTFSYSFFLICIDSINADFPTELNPVPQQTRARPKDTRLFVAEPLIVNLSAE